VDPRSAGRTAYPNAVRATKAYIASFGTTGLLLASALLTLSVMSAFVAFNGFPGQDLQSPITPILVHERQAPLTIPAHPSRADRQTADQKRTGRSSAGGSTRRRTSSDTPVAQSDPLRQRATTQSPTTSAPDSSQQTGSTNTPTSGPVETLTTQPSLPSDTVPSAPTVSTPSLPLDTGTLDSTVNSTLDSTLNTGTVDTGTVTQILSP
jgi:hypothetical protein